MAKVNPQVLVKNSMPIGAVVSVVTVLVIWLLSLGGFKVASLMSSVPLSSAITPTLGGKIVQGIDGVLPLGASTSSILLTALTVMSLFIAGSFFYAYVTPNLGKSTAQKLAAILLYGTVIAYFVVQFTAGQALSVPNGAESLILGLGIFYLIDAYAAVWAANYFKIRLAV